MSALVLASASPQRRAILEQVGIPFSVRVSGVDEETHGDPSAVAEENARRKAAAIDYAHFKEGAAATTLGADTLVAVDGDILGKPADAAQAREYVARLAGRTHQVVGAIALMYASSRDPDVAVEITQVHFRPASDATLDWYVGTGEWEGRAGGYAIQGAGAVLVAGIEGDYLNVVGLPLQRLLDLAPTCCLPRADGELAREHARRAEERDAVGGGDAAEALDVGRTVQDGQLGPQGGRARLAQEGHEVAGGGGDEHHGARVTGAVGVRDSVRRRARTRPARTSPAARRRPRG